MKVLKYFLPQFAQGRGDFDLLRLVGATLVVVSHSYELLPGQTDPLPGWLGHGFQHASGVGLVLFFFISGHLIYPSLMRSAGLMDYLTKRCARILPGLVGVVLFCILILGPSTTELGLQAYFTNSITYLYFINVLLANIVYELPGVMEHAWFRTTAGGVVVNGSLWTLIYEFFYYCAIIPLLLLRRWQMPIVIGVAFCAVALQFLFAHTGLKFYEGGWLPIGVTKLANYYVAIFGLAFSMGMVARLVLHRVPLSGWVVMAAWVVDIYLPSSLSAAKMVWFVMTIGYTVMYLAYTPLLQFLQRPLHKVGDLSYGVYLYSFPMQQLVIHMLGTKIEPWLVFSLSMAASLPLAFVSWHLLELPVLRVFKRGTTSAKPPAKVGQYA